MKVADDEKEDGSDVELQEGVQMSQNIFVMLVKEKSLHCQTRLLETFYMAS